MVYRCKLCDGCEISDRIKGERRQHGRIRRMGLIIAKRQRVAIRGRLRDRLGANNCRPSGPVIHHKGATGDVFLQGSRKGARQNIR